MYVIKLNAKTLFGIAIFISILYGAQLFILYESQCILDSQLTSNHYLLPMIIILIFAILIFLNLKISESLYCFIYNILDFILDIYYTFSK
jgi:hypothetical protein